MGYELVLDMGLSDFAVTRAIKELSLKDEEAFGCTEIAEHIGCSKRTVERVIPHLLEAGVVIRKGSPRVGYRYEYVEPKNAKCG